MAVRKTITTTCFKGWLFISDRTRVDLVLRLPLACLGRVSTYLAFRTPLPDFLRMPSVCLVHDIVVLSHVGGTLVLRFEFGPLVARH